MCTMYPPDQWVGTFHTTAVSRRCSQGASGKLTTQSLQANLVPPYPNPNCKPLTKPNLQTPSFRSFARGESSRPSAVGVG